MIKLNNIGVDPIDGDNDDIYSEYEPLNVFSLLNYKQKYDKKRPPPTYIEFCEYEEMAKQSANHPMTGLKIREDLERIECVNEEIIESNKGLKAYLLKELAKNIFRGNASVSLPAYAFNPISNVSALMNNFRTSPYFLNKAVHIGPNSDPEERIKLITAMCISSLHQNISFKRAFNPILGETYQGYFVFENPEVFLDDEERFKSLASNRLQVMRSKTMKAKSQPTNLKSKFINIFVEQISHHPPVGSFQIEHSEGDYAIYGFLEEDFKRNGSNLEFRMKGETFIKFSDGDEYSITWPAKVLENSVYMKYDEFIRIEQISDDSNLTSMVFFGDSKDKDGLEVDGLIYYRDPDKDFNMKAKSQKNLKDIDETGGEIQGSWVKQLIIGEK